MNLILTVVIFIMNITKENSTQNYKCYNKTQELLRIRKILKFVQITKFQSYLRSKSSKFSVDICVDSVLQK